MKKYIIIFFCGLIFANPALCADQSNNASVPTTDLGTANVSNTADTSDTNTSSVTDTGYTKSELGQPLAQEIVVTPKGVIKEVPAEIQPVLKRIDISRIGSAPYYETFEGLRLAKYFTVAQRVEIFQQPRPIDAYVMDAKKIRWLHWHESWNTDAEFREQIQPIFTRAYGTEITMSDPKNREGQIKYTLDYRDIYQNQFPIYVANPQPSHTDIPYTINNNYKHEQWDQNEILFMHAKRIPGIGWFETLNFGYRYSTMSAKNDGATDSYYETRHTYFTYFSLAPSERCEFFGQFEYFKSKRPKSEFVFSPDHYFWATEIRMKTKDLKTSVIPRFSYSIDYYYPFRDKFSKYEMSIRIGHDFTPKLNATDTIRANYAFRDEIDRVAPLYSGDSFPVYDMAGFVGNELRVQYQFYDKLWLQTGLDYAAGTNMCDFDNVGLLAGLEYYAPGLIRVDFGYQGNDYYNLAKDGIGKWLSSFYFKCFFFM